MSDIAKFASPRPWSIAVIQDGHDASGWVIIDAKGNVVCHFFSNDGAGVDHCWKNQLNAALIVSLINKIKP